jgi:hypothetical protein
VGRAPTAAQLNGWVHGQHIPHVKIKIGEGWGREVTRDLHRVRSARHVVGPDAELYVDANGAYTRKQAVRVGHALAEHGAGWFEEPVSSDDLTGLRLVRDAVVCDVTAGEYGFDLPCFARMIAAGAVDCLQIDATLPHCDMFFDGALDPTGGTVRPTQGVGHGLTLRTQEVAEYRVAWRDELGGTNRCVRLPGLPAGLPGQFACGQDTRRPHGQGRAHPPPVP